VTTTPPPPPPQDDGERKKGKPTARPWRVEGRYICGTGRKFVLAELPCEGVRHSAVDAANAALIVKAVNAVDSRRERDAVQAELLDAARAMLTALDTIAHEVTSTAFNSEHILDQVQALARIVVKNHRPTVEAAERAREA
jgi:hypothetical protein